MTFGEWLKQKRSAARMTQQQVGDAVGLTRQQVARIESGEQTTRNATAVKLCDALGADPQEGLSLLVATQTGSEIERIPDPDTEALLYAYEGLTDINKEIARSLIQQLREAESRNSIGGTSKRNTDRRH